MGVKPLRLYSASHKQPCLYDRQHHPQLAGDCHTTAGAMIAIKLAPAERMVLAAASADAALLERLQQCKVSFVSPFN